MPHLLTIAKALSVMYYASFKFLSPFDVRCDEIHLKGAALLMKFHRGNHNNSCIMKYQQQLEYFRYWNAQANEWINQIKFTNKQSKSSNQIVFIFFFIWSFLYFWSKSKNIKNVKMTSLLAFILWVWYLCVWKSPLCMTYIAVKAQCWNLFHLYIIAIQVCSECFLLVQNKRFWNTLASKRG